MQHMLPGHTLTITIILLADLTLQKNVFNVIFNTIFDIAALCQKYILDNCCFDIDQILNRTSREENWNRHRVITDRHFNRVSPLEKYCLCQRLDRHDDVTENRGPYFQVDRQNFRHVTPLERNRAIENGRIARIQNSRPYLGNASSYDCCYRYREMGRDCHDECWCAPALVQFV